MFHGTPASFTTPSLSFCKPYRDFGCGFYLTPNYMDALPMAIKHTCVGYVNVYELTELKSLRFLILRGFSDDWLRFVVLSRLGFSSEYDLVIGKTAAGGTNLKSKFAQFCHASTPPQEVASIMRNELTHTSLGIQYGFLTPKALSMLKLVDIEQIEREDAI